MAFIKDKWVTIVPLCLITLGTWLRASLYGNLNLSIGNPDTPSYIDASTPPILSTEIFTGRRLFTTNVLYKLANDPKRCLLQVTSYPAEGNEASRALQPCFDKIALLQNWISILGWCLQSLFLKAGFLIPIWFTIFVLWVFVRDVHLYALLITAGLTLPFLFLKEFRKSSLDGFIFSSIWIWLETDQLSRQTLSH